MPHPQVGELLFLLLKGCQPLVGRDYDADDEDYPAPWRRNSIILQRETRRGSVRTRSGAGGGAGAEAEEQVMPQPWDVEAPDVRLDRSDRSLLPVSFFELFGGDGFFFSFLQDPSRKSRKRSRTGVLRTAGCFSFCAEKMDK